jgi:hypothetical protein
VNVKSQASLHRLSATFDLMSLLFYYYSKVSAALPASAA